MGMLYLHNDIFLTDLIGYDQLKFGLIFTLKWKILGTSLHLLSKMQPEYDGTVTTLLTTKSSLEIAFSSVVSVHLTIFVEESCSPVTTFY